jgi:hypothetical protein
MSTLAEKAKVEGDEAEAAEEEETPTEPTEPTEPEPEPAPTEPASQMTEQEAEREFKRLEKAAQTYLDKALPIAEKLGMPVKQCPLCTFPGLAIPRGEHEVTSDVEAAVLGMIGKGTPAEFKDSDEYEMCDKCDGWGEVLTGARKEISRTAICNPCGGKGFKPVVQPYVPASPPNGAPPPFLPSPGPAGYEPPRPEPYFDYGTREWKLPPTVQGV